MIVTTSFSVEGHTIAEYLGIVAVTKIGRIGISVKKIEQFWGNGVNAAVDELKERARQLNADAVIAVSFQSSVDGNEIRATGTVVRFG